MIIDTHTHVGADRIYEIEVTEAQLWGTMEKHGIDVSLVQPHFVTPDVPSQRAAHDRVAAFVAAHPGRTFGIATMNPHCEPSDYVTELRRCVRDLGFVGVKLHPAVHACSPSSKDGRLVFATAADLGIPVIVHTGLGIPFSLPSSLLPVAKDFPDVDIVVAHAGMIILAGEALLVAQERPNVYVETSWSEASLIPLLIRQLGPKVMFGSDEPWNAGSELAKCETVRDSLSDEQIQHWLWRTAAHVFRLSVA